MLMRGKEINQDKVRIEMQKQGYDHIKHIAYPEYGEDGTLYIIPRKRKKNRTIIRNMT